MYPCYQRAYQELFLATADTIDVLEQMLNTTILPTKSQTILLTELVRLQSAQQKAEEWILTDSEK